jgi:hypothetical protein
MTYDPFIGHSTFTFTVIYVPTIQIGMVHAFGRYAVAYPIQI